MTGYLVTPFKDHGLVKNEWLLWCRKYGTPFVWALRSGSTYDVEVDTAGFSATESYRISQKGHAHASDFISSLGLKIHLRSHELIHIEKVPGTQVEALCEELVYTAQTHKMRSSST